MSDYNFENWPKHNGRLVCSPEHPMPIGCAEAYQYRWAHTNLKEVDLQRDDWPSGDTVGMKCDDCGIVVEVELPQ